MSNKVTTSSGILYGNAKKIILIIGYTIFDNKVYKVTFLLRKFRDKVVFRNLILILTNPVFFNLGM